MSDPTLTPVPAPGPAPAAVSVAKSGSLALQSDFESMFGRDQVLAASVLIVDDQPVNIQLLKMLLREVGYRNVVTTTDPREALGLYKQHKPDIVLLDLQMPHLDGFGVMAQLREVEPLGVPPILVLTADMDPETRYRALRSGARDFLNKPFDQVETASRIQNLIEMRFLHKRLADSNRLLEQRVRDRTADVRRTQLEVIHRLGRAAEYKDNETGYHIIRMSLYCGALARAIGIPEAEVEVLQEASPMHDVGKIGIPDRILLKPGKLNAEEWEVMQKHAEIGADLLSGSDSPLIQMAQNIAWTHHEKWDGKGYPRGLAAEDIPLAGRIGAICDVFDALTSERPYKHAWTIEDAMAELQRGAGSHFDPTLVAVFATILPEVLEIRSRYQDR